MVKKFRINLLQYFWYGDPRLIFELAASYCSEILKSSSLSTATSSPDLCRPTLSLELMVIVSKPAKKKLHCRSSPSSTERWLTDSAVETQLLQAIASTAKNLSGKYTLGRNACFIQTDWQATLRIIVNVFLFLKFVHILRIGKVAYCLSHAFDDHYSIRDPTLALPQGAE
jgi:hypothetical protein